MRLLGTLRIGGSTLAAALLLCCCTALHGADVLDCQVSVDSVLQDRYSPLHLFDGDLQDTDRRWVSSRAAQPHWVQVSFAAPVTLDTLIVTGHDSSKGLAVADARVQTLQDGQWHTLAAVADNAQQRVTFHWPPAPMQTLRLTIARSCRADTTTRLFEMELSGNGTRYRLAARHQQQPQPSVDPVSDEQLLGALTPLKFPRAVPAGGDQNQSDRRSEYLRKFYVSMLDWGRLVAKEFQYLPGEQSQRDHRPRGYYGDGGHTENSVRPICYAVLNNALLAELLPPRGEGASDVERQQLRDQAEAVIEYLTQAHCVHGGTCANGQPWGNQWQSAMWARALGLGAWIMWDQLERDQQLRVARIVEFEADRFLALAPKSSVKNDTGAEENAWNAGILTLASSMFPRHPRCGQWDGAAKRYLYNIFSVSADVLCTAPADDGRRVCDWVETVNAHSDYTVENHGLVHIGYLKNSHVWLLESAATYALTDRPLPLAGQHHAQDAFDLWLRAMAWDASPLYFGGNDWKLVHTQCSDLLSFSLMNVWLRDRRAARLEADAIDWMLAIQRQQGGYYCVRRDLEYGGYIVSRLAMCYLLRAKMGPGVEPVSEDELDADISGVTLFKYGKAIVHRTPSKLVSFAWGQQRMGTALPRRGNWVVWPHFASYLGLIDGQVPSARHAELTTLQHVEHSNGFSVCGTLRRKEGPVTQDFALLSPAEDLVVYVERLRAGGPIRERETGVVGHEYALGENTRMFYGAQGQAEVQGVGNSPSVLQWPSRWLNVGGQIGYVVCRQAGRQNVIRYHDLQQGEGRVPKLQEWFSLVGDASTDSWAASGDWACIVTFLNQPPDETKSWAQRVTLEVTGDRALCQIGNTQVVVDFAAYKANIR